MVTGFAKWWDSTVPAFLRDFVEGAIAAAVGGAAAAVYQLDLAKPIDAKTVTGIALTAAVAAVIAFTRHKLAPPPAK